MNCDCERQNAPTLPQALFIRNDEEMYEALDRRDGWIAEVAGGQADEVDVQRLVNDAYLRTLSRSPRADELDVSQDYLIDAESVVEGLRDLMWVLINTQEFIANH
jgi:hypothetical protein